MKKIILLGLMAYLALLALPGAPAGAQPAQPAQRLYLRRGAFDPLRAQPSVAAALRADAATSLILAQFAVGQRPAARTALLAAGLRPLAYIPDNALLLRRVGGSDATLRSLPGLRWWGPLAPADKLAPELAALAQRPPTGALALRVLLAPDADASAALADLAPFGGAVQAQTPTAQGTLLRVNLPATALLGLLRHPDVLWIEQAQPLRVQNDQARAITRVEAARRQFAWLDGAGQIVAVTDTGLDVQPSVQAGSNPDFAPGRIAAAFTPAQMAPNDGACAGTTSWSDRHGHGTHVAGTVLGSGARSPQGADLAGMAPAARLVVQAVSLGTGDLSCLTDDARFLALAYDAGARVQNASWGGPSGGTLNQPQYGGYDLYASMVDEFLWEHDDHLLVVAAGNEGADRSPFDGLVDPDTINSPGTAKNVLTVGASENERLPGGGCAFSPPERVCWSAFGFGAAPLAGDPISNNTAGMAAWSSRGPADDGRIKPEIVAPGTNLISAASHHSSASYPAGRLDANYAYDSGTSMATPVVSGLAALTRQWLAHEHGLNDPSAALIKALLLNGAASMGAGQYGLGEQREIPAAWPNAVAGWGRAALDTALGANGAHTVWFDDRRVGLGEPGASATYRLLVSGDAPLRLTLAWADPPASALAGRALVNDLDLELEGPGGASWRGNADAQLGPACRDGAGADRCNNVESIEVAAPAAGLYTLRVRAAQLGGQAQRFALTAHAGRLAASLDAPVASLEGVAGPVVRLSWGGVPGAREYRVEVGADSDFALSLGTFYTAAASAQIVAAPGARWYRVRACAEQLCSAPSNTIEASAAQPPERFFLPGVVRSA